MAVIDNTLATESRQVCRAQRRLLERIGDLERRDAFRADGSTSMVSWVMSRLSVSYPTARAYVAVGHELDRLPALAEAFSAGQVSFDQLRLLVRIATPGTDATLARQAVAWSVTQTEAHVHVEETRRADAQRRRAAEAAERARSAATPNPPSLSSPSSGPSPQPPTAPSRPGEFPLPDPSRACDQGLGAFRPGTLRLRPHAGGGSLEGSLPTEEYAAVESALLSLARSAPADPATGRQAPLAERLADALVGIVTGHETTHGEMARGRHAPNVVVHADIGLLTGEADGQSVGFAEGCGPLAAEVVRRLACDASLRLALDCDGITLDMGRTSRRPSVALTREVLRRDQCCRFPGCDARRFLQIHHVRHWTKNGPTDLDNLAAHCARDHKRIHHGGWKVSGSANGELRYVSPDGRALVSVPSPGWSAPRRRRVDRPQT